MLAEPYKRIRVSQEGEVARLLEQADTGPVLIEKGGSLYQLAALPRSAKRADPGATIAAMHAAVAAWKDGDPEALKSLIYRAREEGTKPPVPR